MTRPSLRSTGDRSPVGVGAGLVVLDLVVKGNLPDSHLLRAGGSCGNVLTILSYLGWRSYPIARLGRDAAAQIIQEDMAQFGVDTEFLAQETSGRTPAIIETIRDGGRGPRTHSYSLHCPQCGSFLPRHRPLRMDGTNRILAQLPHATVFYFDRASPASVLLAQHYRSGGALIVFEPSSMRTGSESLLKRAARLAHILKYSRERLSGVAEALGRTVVPLEIETMGRDGLRYRRKRKSGGLAPWQYMPAYQVSNPVDEAGSGDWCTAGLVHALGLHGAASFWRTRDRGLERGLLLGQALAAINCGFPGARGAMYELLVEDMKKTVQEVARGEEIRVGPEILNPEAIHRFLQSVCLHCKPIAGSR